MMLSLIGLMSLISFAALARERPAQDLIVVVEATDGTILSEAMMVLQQGEHLFLPLIETAQALGLQVQEIDEHLYAIDSGFDQRKLEFPVCQEVVLTKCSSYFTRSERPYLSLGEAQTILKWPLQFDLRRLTLVVETQLSSRPASATKTFEDKPLPDPERAWWGAPQAALGLQHDTEAHLTSLSGQVVAPFAAHDLWVWHRSDYNEWTTKARQQDTEYTLSRESAQADLLGPLGARKYEMFYFNSPDRPYVARARRLSGFQITNRESSPDGLFARQIIRGFARPQWRVELFQNEVYLTEMTVGADSVYEFRDIPLYYGQNQFTIVLTSPLGQKEIRRESYQVGSQSLKPGRWGYSISQGRDKLQSQSMEDVQLHHAVNSNIEVGVSRQRWNHFTYWSPQILTTGDGWSLALTGIENTSGGRALAVAPRTQWGRTLLGAEHAQFQDFQSGIINTGGIFDQTSETQVSQLSPINLGDSNLPVMLQNRYIERGYKSQSAERELNLRLVTRHELSTYSVETRKNLDREGFQDATLQWIYSTLRQRVLTQLQGTSERARLFGVDWDTNVTDRRTLGAGFQSDLADSNKSYIFAKAAQDFHSFEGDMRIEAGREIKGVLSISTVLGYQKTAGNYQAKTAADPADASLFVDFFIDENGNGQKDEKEKEVEKLRLRDVVSRREYETDAGGRVEIFNIAPYRRLELEVLVESIPNIYLTPLVKKIELYPTPAQKLVRRIPIVSRFDLRGSVKVKSWKRLIPVRILKADGEVFAEGTTRSDGSFAFNEVPAGDYQIEISPEFVKTNLLDPDLSRRTLSLRGEGGVQHLDPLLAF